MPDEQRIFHRDPQPDALGVVIPPLLIAVGAITLLRMSRFLSLVALGVFLYDAASASDDRRKARGRDLVSRQRASALLDRESADSFPASDPPSFAGDSAGAPDIDSLADRP